MGGDLPQDLDLIIMTTMTPDTACPAGANWLGGEAKAVKAVSFDVTAACSGFVFGLSVAEQYLKAGTFKTVLVAAAEIMSRTLDWTDRESCILWGDGAGVAILRAFDNPPEEKPSGITEGKSPRSFRFISIPMERTGEPPAPGWRIKNHSYFL